MLPEIWLSVEGVPPFLLSSSPQEVNVNAANATKRTDIKLKMFFFMPFLILLVIKILNLVNFGANLRIKFDNYQIKSKKSTLFICKTR